MFAFVCQGDAKILSGKGLGNNHLISVVSGNYNAQNIVYEQAKICTKSGLLCRMTAAKAR